MYSSTFIFAKGEWDDHSPFVHLDSVARRHATPAPDGSARPALEPQPPTSASSRNHQPTANARLTSAYGAIRVACVASPISVP